METIPSTETGRRAPITIGQFAVRGHERPTRTTFTDIVGPHYAAELVDARQEHLAQQPKPTPALRLR